MCVGILWLAGQFTTLIGWATLGAGELSATVDAEGWLFQRATGRWVGAMTGSSFGVRTMTRRADDAAAHHWSVALADSRLRHPVPGVLLASGTQFRIVAIRHWLMFLLVLSMWLIWQLGIPALRKRNSVHRETGQDTSIRD